MKAQTPSDTTARSMASAPAAQYRLEAYIRDVAGQSPADQIAGVTRRLDARTIIEGEHQLLQVKALR